MTAGQAAPAAGLSGLLDPGERLLWQGRPDTTLSFAPLRPAQIVLGLALAAFALFWTGKALPTGGADSLPDRILPLFGLVFLLLGLYAAGGYALWDRLRRRHSRYLLTDRRALIVTDLPLAGRRLKSCPIGPDTVLERTETPPGTIWFSHEHRRRAQGSTRAPIGFERIPDAREVFGRMRAIQRGEI
ncbi:aspartate carbamoyltransferase catalytic subunit [Salipiger sp. P9]|uniref:aspartate carbamoyltransferase catalytic subunit n=1 Tax=Salipiger pentaromativorans TaxID=2943193 RepID=UPI0021581721|nr:aspartate carbamoyltransferase catalytic subunit [Salipiger pentaromativorans]MCR8548703.1 aspartate carbamoyltransferase catalytic subunit [Salipiger pentaromativorans]